MLPIPASFWAFSSYIGCAASETRRAGRTEINDGKKEETYMCYKCNRANGVINTYSSIAAGIGAIPIPGSDIVPLLGLQYKMVVDLGSIYDEKLDVKDAMAVATSLGVGGFVARAAARTGLKFIPFGGWAICGGVAAAGTKAFGETAKRYFRNLKGCAC